MIRELGRFGFSPGWMSVWFGLMSFAHSAEPDEFAIKPLPQVPTGWIVERVAEPPLVQYPMMGRFDEEGRLYLAENAGVNHDFDTLLRDLPSFIRVLEDTTGDGQFDSSRIFADRMAFPAGALPVDGSVYVASPPNLWKLTDRDGDGVADDREALIGRFGSIGNAADLHGPYLGLDGRLYWCDGRHGHEFEPGPGQTRSRGDAARIFTARLDGSDARTWAGGGMDNPVALTFSRAGEPIGTVALLENAPRKDAVVHWQWGGVYPRRDQQQAVAEFHRTGELLDPIIWFGQVAPAGILTIRKTGTGTEFDGDLLVAQFNTHKVVRIRIERSGSSFIATEVADFLVSEDPDFHPTEVVQDGDGSILIVDTGGWFRQGCPLSQVAKPNIRGAIYRVRQARAPRIMDPWGQQLEWRGETVTGEVLADRLRDDRPRVRDRAIRALAHHPHADAALVEALADSDAEVRLAALWAAGQRGDLGPVTPALQSALRQALDDSDPEIRQAACHLSALRADEAALPRLRTMLTDDDLGVRRSAAVALGRSRDREAVDPLLAALDDPQVDRPLEHALLYALIEIAEPERMRTMLASREATASQRRAALIVVRAIDPESLTAEAVFPLVDTADAALRRTAFEVIEQQPTWGREAVGLLMGWLREPSTEDVGVGGQVGDSGSAAIRALAVAFGGDPAFVEPVANWLADPSLMGVRQLALLEGLRSAGNPVPEAWLPPLVRLAQKGPEASATIATELLATAPLAAMESILPGLAHDPGRPASVRWRALEALARRGQPIPSASFDWLMESLATAPADVRLTLFNILAAAPLSAEQQAQLIPEVATANVLELPILLMALERAAWDDANQRRHWGIALGQQLEKSPGRASLPIDRLQQLVEAYGMEDDAQWQGLRAEQEAQQRERFVRLDRLLTELPTGDAERGRGVFVGTKAACSACHPAPRRVGTGRPTDEPSSRADAASLAAAVGPDLSAIATVRTRRDLLEAIILPSQSFARGFESYVIALESGEVLTGVIQEQTPLDLVLVGADRRPRRISRSEIERIELSPTSIMPQGLDQSLSPRELADLLAYLETLREP